MNTGPSNASSPSFDSTPSLIQDSNQPFDLSDFDITSLLNNLQSDNTLLSTQEESQYSSLFDEFLQDDIFSQS